jgi:chromate reductase, NAD(P)H dehydrogenase (quinone)
MYTIIAATNRKGSNTRKVANQYQLFLKENGVEAQILSLEDFNSFDRDEAFDMLEKKYLQSTTKYIFIMPEYNGSFPGIFKLLMDLSDLATCWNHKKVMLVGVSSGRAGNLRGIDSMTNMCHYMKMNVFYQKMPISNIHHELKDDTFVQESTIKAIGQQITDFIQY